MNASPVVPNVRRVLLLVLAAAAAGVIWFGMAHVAHAAWLSWTQQQVVFNFTLTGGAQLDGDVAWRFNSSNNQAQVWGNNISTETMSSIYVYAIAGDKCAVSDPWTYYAGPVDHIGYNRSTIATNNTPPSGVGTYQNCASYHSYRWYDETWGVDPPPNWQWTWGHVIN